MAGTTRRLRVNRGRSDVMTFYRRSHLECGCYLLPPLPGEVDFADDDERRATWLRNRAVILAEWDRPGARPAALWDYDHDWPEEAESESHALHLMITSGELEPVVPDELARIEAAWRKGLELEALKASVAREVPDWYRRQHWPAVKAEREAASEAWQRTVAKLTGKSRAAG